MCILLPKCKLKYTDQIISRILEYFTQCFAGVKRKIYFTSVSLKVFINIYFRSSHWRCSIKTASFKHCVKSAQIRSYFWSVFCSNRTKYGDLRNKSSYSVQIQEKRTRNNSVFGHLSRSESFAMFTGKHLCWSLFSIKLQVWRGEILFEKDSNTGVFL